MDYNPFLRKTMSASLATVTLLLCVTLTFGRSLTKIPLPSNARPGHVVALLPTENSDYDILDSSNGQISKLFEVSNGGQLITTSDLSDFIGQNLNFKVKCAHDHNPWQQFFSVNVVHPSEARQHFIGQPFRGFISENTPSGSLVSGLEDLHENLKNFENLVDLSIVRGHKELFDIKKLWPFANPSIVNKAVLDREGDSKFHFTLRGLMKDGMEAFASVFVDVKSTNDNKPKFTQKEYVAAVPVTSDSSTAITHIHADDADANDAITYSVEDNDLISVNSQTGEVRLQEGAELMEKSYEFQVHATDASGNEAEAATLRVEGYEPVVVVPLGNSIEHTRLKRATRARADLTFVVSRTTQGQVFTVRNYEPTCTEVYNISSSAPPEIDVNRNTGMITLTGMFNQTVTEVRFTVNVACSNDNSFADTQLVIMKIVDRTSFDPIFSNEPYPIKLRVANWTRPYTHLVTLKSIDAAMGADVRYTILSDEFNETETSDPEELEGAQGRFTIDAVSGELRTRGRMMFNCPAPIQIAVSAQARRANPAITQTPAQVIQVYCNENLPPQFNRPVYNISMDELTNPTTVVVSMAAKSFYDLGLTYSIASADGRPLQFAIDPATGDVRPVKALDRVYDPWRYVMMVTATEAGSGFTSSIELVINLRDINNYPPKFPVSVYVSTNISEAASVGIVVLRLTVIDRDSGTFGRVTFTVDNPLFAIQPDANGDGRAGTLVVNGPLDYDLLPTRMYKVTVTARDGGGLTGTTTVQVWPVNVNDQAPVFEPRMQRVWLKMTARSNTLVHVLQAYDLDGGNLRFRFNDTESEDPANSPTQWGPFTLERNTGRVILTGNLLELGRIESYTIPVIVEDDSSCCPGTNKTNIGEGVLYIDFIVVNSPPAFLDCATYKPMFKEGQPVGTGAINVTATDSDSGSNGELTYSLIYQDLEPVVFGIRNVARVNGPYVAEIFSNFVFNRSNPQKNFFRYDGNIVYPVTVQATDNGRPRLAATCFFLITIEDINDHQPRFDSTQYKGKVLNTVAPQTRVLRVFAFDEDLGENARVAYSLDPPITRFSIDPVMGYITVTGSIANETSIDFTVRARDNGTTPLTSTSRVTLEVVTSPSQLTPQWQKINNVAIDDMPPIEIFENFTYGGKLPNNLNPNNYTASGTNTANVYYFVPPGLTTMLNSQKDFSSVENQIGQMQVVTNELLDYETTPEYLLTLRASWLNEQNQFSDARLKVRLKDVNDNSPRFIGLDSTGKFPAAAPENKPGPLLISVVYAIDLDGTYPNNNVEYKFTTNCMGPQGDCQYFTLDGTTGVIRSKVNQTFHREEKSLYTLEVYALDGLPTWNEADRRRSDPWTVPVQVIITGGSTNEPRFEQSLYPFTIDPGLKFNVTVGTVTGVIPDPDINYPQYGITDGNDKHLFAVNFTTGRIYTVGFVVPEAPNDFTYSLTYRVFDGLFQNVTTTVNVNLNQINLFPPRFGNPSYEVVNITEESPYSGVILSAAATDPETGVVGQVYSASGELYSSERFEVKPNGSRSEVLLRQTLDRDFPRGYSNWQINLEAQDSSGMKGYSVMNLRLIDINDNPPIFDTCCLTGKVPENQANSQFLRVFTNDYDMGDNAKVTFEPLNQTALDNQFFSIDATTGMITNTRQFDRESRDRYEILVEARDNPTSGEIRNTVTQKIVVMVDDVNDNSPVFRNSNYEIWMPEEIPIDGSVGWVKADDADIGENAKLTYSITDSPGTIYFFMDSVYAAGTGVIRVKQRVDYDAPNSVKDIPFSVLARDPNPANSATATVTIRVYDVNDNAPVITNPNQNVTVNENAPIGEQIVAGFAANDIDQGENATFKFYIDYKNSDPGFNFAINSSAYSGRVTLKNTLDWERNNGQRLRILAIDEGKPPMTGTATVTINVVDVNNHAPTIEQPAYPPVLRTSYGSTQVTIATLPITDRDSPANGPPFNIANDLVQCTQPYCQDLRFVISGNNLLIQNKQLTYSRDNFKAYYPVVAIRDTASSGGQLTSTTTLTILIEDKNDNPPQPGTKTITAYNYRGLYDNVFIGSVYVEEADDWDKADKTYTMVGDNEFFQLRDHGDIYMMRGAMSQNLLVRVSDQVHNKEVTCTVQVKVIYIDEEAVKSSGSFRFEGTTAEEFLNTGKIDLLRKQLSQVLNTAEENIEIFTVQQNPTVRNQVFVRYAAHGSPYYTPTRLDGRAQLNKERIQQAVGLRMLQAPVDVCISMQCWDGGCTNALIIKDNPLTVNGNKTSLVGVDAYIEGSCTCGARNFTEVPANPQVCRGDSCLNGGTCRETWGDVTCTCLEGFDGPRCQQLRHSFPGNGWAWYNPLETCYEDIFSLDIATQVQTGLLLYQGPMFDTQAGEMRDFIMLELVGGYPRLRMNLGDGELALTITGRNVNGTSTMPPLSDGQWHNIEVIRDGMVVRLIVDYCRAEVIEETLGSSKSDRSACEAKGTIPGFRFVLRGTTPLQLGGRMNVTNYPQNVPTAGFNGCVKNVRHNGVLYDLHIGEKGQHYQTQDGCPREDAQCVDCPANSTCSSGLTTSRVCTCHPGLRGSNCDIATTAKSFYEQGGFMEWGLSNSFNTSLSRDRNELQVMFRTRQENGVIFQASSFTKLEHIKLVLVNSKLNLLIDLGSDERSLVLNGVNASSGQWNTVKVMRQGNQVILSMNGGDGRYYAERPPAEEHRLLALSGKQIFGGAKVEYKLYRSQATVESTLLESCINDIRYDNRYFPMTSSEDSSITDVDLVNNVRSREGCEVSNVCAGVTCPENFLCINAWLIPYCMCPTGHAIIDGSCIRLMTCAEEPCQNGGICVDIPGVGVECQCPEGYFPPFCSAGAVVGGLDDGAIAGIVIGSLLFLLLLILLIILLLRCRKKEPLLIDEPDDDIRENVVFYDEEGAGEEDMLAFDISRLQKPIDGDDMSLQQKNMIFPVGAMRREERPLGLGAEPMSAPRYPQPGPDGKYPHIGDFIDDRMGDADYDPNAPPYDSVREYQYEGSNSINGSLSSLNSSSSASEQDYDYLNNWGPRFAKLAEMYGGGEDEDDEDASSV